MDPAARESLIKTLEEQLELCRLEAASLDNDADRRFQMAERGGAIQLMLDLLRKKLGR